MLAQLQSRLRGNVQAGTGGHVVEDDRDPSRIGHGGEVRDQACLGGLVVIRGDQQQGIGTALGRLCSQCAAVVGVVGTGTRDDGHPVVDGIDGELNGSQLLFIGHGGALTGGSADDDGIGAARDLVLDDAAQLVKIDAAILVHRGDDRYARAGKDRIFHSVRSPFAVFGNADQSK